MCLCQCPPHVRVKDTGHIWKNKGHSPVLFHYLPMDSLVQHLPPACSGRVTHDMAMHGTGLFTVSVLCPFLNFFKYYFYYCSYSVVSCNLTIMLNLFFFCLFFFKDLTKYKMDIIFTKIMLAKTHDIVD